MDKLKKIFNQHKSRSIVSIVIVIVLILTTLNITTLVYNHSQSTLLKTFHDYADNIYEVNRNAFVVLSVLKAGLDIVEGSTIGASVFVTTEIEVGDVVQPIYDIVNVLWYATLVVTVIVKAEQLFYEYFGQSMFIYIIYTALILYLIRNMIIIFVPEKISKIKPIEHTNRLIKKIVKALFLFSTMIYIIIPVALLISLKISSEITEDMFAKPLVEISDSVDKLTKVQDKIFELDKDKSIFNVSSQYEDLEKDIVELKDVSSSTLDTLSKSVPLIIASMLFTNFILPMLVIYFLYQLFKYMFR